MYKETKNWRNSTLIEYKETNRVIKTVQRWNFKKQSLNRATRFSSKNLKILAKRSLKIDLKFENLKVTVAVWTNLDWK